MTATLEPEGAIGTKIKVCPVEEARAALDAHLATDPGPYNPKLPPTHPHNEAWRRFVKLKEPLVIALEQAIAFQNDPNAETIHRRRDPLPTSRPTTRIDRKPVSHFVEKINGLLKQMSALDIWSDEWDRLRCQASAHRSTAVKRAKEDRDPTPIPEVPRRGRKPYGKRST